MQYTISTNADQEAALEQELKIANGKRLEANPPQPEWTTQEFVQAYFNDAFAHRVDRHKQAAVQRIAQKLVEKPELVAAVEATLAAER